MSEIYPEARVWCTLDNDGEWKEIAQSAQMMDALETEALKLGLQPGYTRDGSFQQIYVKGNIKTIETLLVNCNMLHGEYGYSMDVGSEGWAAYFEGKLSALIGNIDIEDDLATGDEEKELI